MVHGKRVRHYHEVSGWRQYQYLSNVIELVAKDPDWEDDPQDPPSLPVDHSGKKTGAEHYTNSVRIFMGRILVEMSDSLASRTPRCLNGSEEIDILGTRKSFCPSYCAAKVEEVCWGRQSARHVRNMSYLITDAKTVPVAWWSVSCASLIDITECHCIESRYVVCPVVLRDLS